MRLLKESPGPEALAWAGLAGFALDALVAAILLFAFVDRVAPPQDLPWKPFSLDQPLGLATSGKLARIAADPSLCLKTLSDGHVGFDRVPARSEGFCTIRNAGRITVTTPLRPAGPVVTCREALALALFDRQVLRPAAREFLDSEVVEIDHYGTYACRRIYGQKTGRVSEHARANAFDFAGVRLKDGRRVTIAADFRKDDAEGRFARAVRDRACRVFRTVLSPDYNAAHRDHLHLDMGPFRVCR